MADRNLIEDGAQTLFAFLQSGFRAATPGHVVEDDDPARDLALRISDRSGAVLDGGPRAVAPDERRVVGESDHVSSAEDIRHGVLRCLPCVFVHDPEDRLEGQDRGTAAGCVRRVLDCPTGPSVLESFSTGPKWAAPYLRAVALGGELGCDFQWALPAYEEQSALAEVNCR